MQSDNPRISDLTRMFTAAAGTFAGMAQESAEAARERFKEALGGLDFVSREEFEAVKEMAVKAREENEKLAARIAELEAAAKPATVKKATAKKDSAVG
ncbi:accessory factor UbiK family protein [Croceicoccus bisphenolivorans]|uniref:accessory factor UbiK family protein n=1 Tax=Croceicoccus bisphenolivorans TaxID=1783232 RepID=UPI00082D6194|nr:accessory factor UbiK family protein [Croceicoccus bisphenolivorans]